MSKQWRAARRLENIAHANLLEALEDLGDGVLRGAICHIEQAKRCCMDLARMLGDDDPEALIRAMDAPPSEEEIAEFGLYDGTAETDETGAGVGG